MNDTVIVVSLILIIVFAILSIYNLRLRKAKGFFFLYLFLWLLCGLIYFSISVISNDNFVIQDNIKTKSLIASLSDELGSKYNYVDVERIVDNRSYNINIRMLHYDDLLHYVSTEPVGYDWGELYENYYNNMGMTHFSYNLIDVVNIPRLGRIKSDKIDAQSQNDNFKLSLDSRYLYKLTLIESYPTFIGRLKNHDIINGTENNMSCYILLEDKIDKYLPKLEENNYINIEQALNRLISKSYSLLDNKIHLFKGLESENVNYQAIDFLYFSAVTITTLGFGDILPNSTIVRFVVMIETLLGLLIIGYFISYSIDDSKMPIAKGK